MDEPDAQHAHDLSNQKFVVLARVLGCQVHFTQTRSRVARGVRHQLHDQNIIEVPVRLRHTHTRGYELIQRVDLGVFPRRLLLLASEARALAHGARLPAATDFASFLVLRAFLEAALRHVAINLGAADPGAGADYVNCRFLAALEGTHYFVDHPIVNEGLQAGGCLHRSSRPNPNYSWNCLSPADPLGQPRGRWN